MRMSDWSSDVCSSDLVLRMLRLSRHTRVECSDRAIRPRQESRINADLLIAIAIRDEAKYASLLLDPLSVLSAVHNNRDRSGVGNQQDRQRYARAQPPAPILRAG